MFGHSLLLLLANFGYRLTLFKGTLKFKLCPLRLFSNAFFASCLGEFAAGLHDQVFRRPLHCLHLRLLSRCRNFNGQTFQQLLSDEPIRGPIQVKKSPPFTLSHISPLFFTVFLSCFSFCLCIISLYSPFLHPHILIVSSIFEIIVFFSPRKRSTFNSPVSLSLTNMQTFKMVQALCKMNEFKICLSF
jgi:hypothetical protein